MRIIHAFIGALLLLGVWSAAGIAPGSSDPLRYAAHGAIFGPGGEQISKPTAGFLRAALDAYVKRALAAASPAQRAEFVATRGFAAALAGEDGLLRLHAETLVLDRLVEAARPADADALFARTTMLRYLLEQAGAPAFSDQQRAMLEQAGLRAAPPPAVTALPAPDFALAQQREAYLKQCVAAGVPRPPEWDPSGATWAPTAAELKASEAFIIKDSNARVYRVESTKPAGICLALPRYKPTPASAPFTALGIICMGKDTDNGSGVKVTSACFWDNQVRDPANPANGGYRPENVARDAKVPIVNFAAGEELKNGGGGVCTMCHAGANAFVVHPRHGAFRELSRAGKLAADSYYVPIPAPGASWPRAPANTKLGKNPAQRTCMRCHDVGGTEDAGQLPEVTAEIKAEYCANVLLPSLGLGAAPAPPRTMPPAEPLAVYADDVKALIDACK
jgi:hypothetical protein